MEPGARDVLIRDATSAELDDVAAVMLAAYEQYMPEVRADMPEDMREAFEGYRNDIADVRGRLDDSTLIVAEHGGKLAGSVTYYAPGAIPEQNEHGFPAGWSSIRLLAVHPSARGLGVGRLLTEECMRRARTQGAHTMGLHTTEMMEVARGMYERMGFARAPEHDFFPVPEFCVMAYRLALVTHGVRES